MTSSDVRSILNLPASASHPAHPRPAAAGPPAKRQRPEGVSREVFALLGDHVPSVQAAALEAAAAAAAAGSSLKFKEKARMGKKAKPAEKWVNRKFRPAGRESREGFHDSLELSHWTKASDSTDPKDDPFVKYTQPSPTPVYEFSQHEYDQHLTDPDWTAHETQYLFGLLKSFDCRFVIVADRYAYPGERGEYVNKPGGSSGGGESSASGAAGGGSPTSSSVSSKGKEKASEPPVGSGASWAGQGGKRRSIEDIKSRYYSVCRRLVRSRPTGDEIGKTQMLQYYAFDKERELARKAYAASLFSLTPAQIAEEEALYLECKRMEQQERTFRAERDELMKSLGGAATVVMAQIVNSSANADKKRKEAAVEGAVVGPNGLTGNKKLDKATKADLLHCIYRPPLPPVASGPGTSSVKGAQTLLNAPVHLRSQRAPAVPPKPSEEVIAGIIASLRPEVPLPGKLVMPTRGNLDKMEGLMLAAGGLGEMKAAVDKCEHEARVLRERLELRKRMKANGGSTAATSRKSTPAPVFDAAKAASPAVPAGGGEGAMEGVEPSPAQ